MQGILLINKPLGYTSQQTVSKVKKILNVKKAGHTGTLDPLATGVLPILLENYTKLSKYLIEHDKTYIAKVRLGQKSSTGDLEGEIIDKKAFNKNSISSDNVEHVLKSFLGKQNQIPPKYSSIKVNGKKLYEYARLGQNIEVPPREIEIYNIKLINIESNEIEFEVSCSKGTYIRTLCEDIANRLGTVGLMSSLIRTEVDKFKICDAITIEELERKEIDIESKLIKMENIFPKLESIVLNHKKTELFLNGVLLAIERNEGLYNIYSYENKYLGTGIIKNQLLKRDVII